MQLNFTFRQVLGLLIVLFWGTGAMAQISIPNASFTDAQDFGTLANTGTSSTVPAGWAFSEAGANQNALYAAGTGSSNAGDTYSFGFAAPNTERAFGGLQAGSLIPTVGVCYTNNTTATITGLTVTYTGETWRVGAANRTDGIQFQYNQNTTGIGGAGTWTSFPALDYFNPGQAAVGSGSVQHSASISSPITGLSIAPGATFCFRWTDFNATGADDGIGIDDYSLTNIVAPSPCDVITPLPCGTAVAQSLSGTGFWNTSFCGNSTVGSEAVYSFTPTVSGVHTLIINGVGGDPVDFGYKLASDGCSSSGWNCIGTSTGTSYYTFGPLTAGAQYYILLDAHTTAFSAQNFEINCNRVPANDLCFNAITIPAVAGNICGTTLGANPDTPNGGATCGTSADGFGAGVWYTFQGNGQDWSFFFPAQSMDWDPEVNVYSGSCGALTCVIGDDDSGGGLNAQFTVSNTMAGTTYYVYVHPADDFGNGTVDFCFDLTLSGAPPVALTCPVPTTASACLTQSQVDAAYNAWLTSATASGGCNGSLTNDSQGAPSICSATAVTRTVIWTYSSTCAPTTTTCSSTFTVPAYPTFTLPANGAATVACPALAVQPTPPSVVDGCGKTLTPTGPVVSNVPNPLICEGTRTYAWTYTDCAGHVLTWSFVYTIERNPFTVPANGAATVACLAAITVPVPPAVNSNCGEPIAPAFVSIVDSPTPLTCEGTRTYNYSYTDCEGNTLPWSFVYTIERNPFTVPANGAATVNSPASATQPTPPTVTSNCGETLTPTGPVVTNSPNPIVCTGTRTYAWTYTDCEGNTAVWSFVYTIIDNAPPMASCSNSTLTFNGQESIVLNANTFVTATDNCGIQSITLNPTAITCQQVGQQVPVTATVTDNNGNTATCTSTITVAGLPCGWSQNPDGVGCEDGNSNSFNAATGVYTATSTGCFYGPPYTADETSFAQRTLCGNGSITALVTGISGSALGWAGVVMRESNAAGAKKAQLMTNLSTLSRREFRTSTNGASQLQQFPSQDRYWLRITRVGNQFTMFVSANGINWFPAGAQNIVMDNCIQMGLIATNYTANSTVTATFAGVSFTGSNPISGANINEVVESIDAPQGFEVYPNPTGGELNVDLANYVGRMVRLEVYSLEGKLLQFGELDEVQNVLERLDLKSLQNGMYLVKVKSAGLPDATQRVVLTRK